MAFRTLAELESDIRYQYDIEGFTDRHSQANIFRLINTAYRHLRDRLTSDGCSLFLKSVEWTQSTTGATSPHPGTLITVSLELQTIYSIHVKVGSSWYRLEHCSYDGLLGYSDGEQSSIPRAWAAAGMSLETNAGSSLVQTMHVVVAPPLDVSRQFRATGVAPWDDLVSGTGTDSIATDFGFDQYIIAAVGVDLATRDDDSQLWDRRFAERERIYQETRRRSNRTPSARQRTDVRGRRGRSW